MNAMGYFGELLRRHIEQKGLSFYRVAVETPGLDTANLSMVATGKRRPTDRIISLLASVEALDLKEATLKAWRLLDEEKSLAKEIAEEIDKYYKQEEL